MPLFDIKVVVQVVILYYKTSEDSDVLWVDCTWNILEPLLVRSGAYVEFYWLDLKEKINS